MNSSHHKNPISELSSTRESGVLAVITGVEGPSYRPIGAMMAIFPDGRRVGTLSSGCIESDLAHHAESALQGGKMRTVKYGHGSPYVDIQLPCGGGLEILLLPDPDKAVLQKVADYGLQRKPCTLNIDCTSGALTIGPYVKIGFDKDTFQIGFLPEIRFVIFGKGPEAATFAALVNSADYENVILSPDEETLLDTSQAGCETVHLVAPRFPSETKVDPWTAIVLFFHDHEWEPPVLHYALESDAFYIGAQGSQRARDTRFEALKNLGVAESDLKRLHGPIGSIPSVRDARTLAVSVLSEILALAHHSDRS